MGLLSDSIIMVQYFPDTGDYVVHHEGAKIESFTSDDEIEDSRINRFLRECLAGKLYHESTLYLSVNQATGTRSRPVRQIVYCKSFDAEEKHGQNTAEVSNINWVLWTPRTCELTVNRGKLGVSKVAQVPDLTKAPDEVREFMTACTDGDHIALVQRYSEPDRSGSQLKMVEVAEFFFSVSKVIYGFQHERVSSITPEEMEELGLKHL